jgi:hypothetical protein
MVFFLSSKAILGNDFLRLHSGTSLREATVWHVEVGPLHNVLKKGFK